MNLLSAGAAFGVVTAVFQWGWGASLLGIDETGPIEAFLPVLMFAILFGLSMDYEVFLVSRIYEEWHRRGDNREAVTHGLAATGRTITAAAAIMVLVFGAFVLGGERIIKLFGIGLATAVLLDALIVRSVARARADAAGRRRATGGCPPGSTARCRTCGSRARRAAPPPRSAPHSSRRSRSPSRRAVEPLARDARHHPLNDAHRCRPGALHRDA